MKKEYFMLALKTIIVVFLLLAIPYMSDAGVKDKVKSVAKKTVAMPIRGIGAAAHGTGAMTEKLAPDPVGEKAKKVGDKIDSKARKTADKLEGRNQK